MIDNGLRVFVFPDAQDHPALGFQHFGGIYVAIPVALDLPVPPVAVRGWASPVLRAPVPEASIDKDCQLRAREGDINLSTPIAGYRQLYAVSESSSMKARSQGKLGRGVPTSKCRHLGAESAAGRDAMWFGSAHEASNSQ